MSDPHAESLPPWVRIEQLADHIGQRVTLKGWLFNRRGSGKIQFIHLRDGSGFVQCVMGVQDVPTEVFERAKKLTQESSIIVTGTVSQEERAPYCGFELQADGVELVSESVDYPITKKEHGDAFLMDHRHLKDCLQHR